MARKVKRFSVAVWILAILLCGTFLASYAMLLSVFLWCMLTQKERSSRAMQLLNG